MAKPVPIHEALLDQTIAMVAEAGLEKISLRTIAAQAGCTTAVIFQQHGGKAGLMAAALRRALAQDEAAHAALAAECGGLLTSHSSLADFLAGYVALRAGQPVPRFWSEVLFKSKQVGNATSHLVRWHAMRTAFWSGVLGGVSTDPVLAEMIAGYTAMEETYAYPLAGEMQYQLLLRETARALTGTVFGPSPAGDGAPGVSARLDRAPLPSASTEAVAMREQLLSHAVAAIVEDGIGTINKRGLTDKAAVSSSMIAYHFGDMRSFVNEAVWRALVHGIPRELDPTLGNAAIPATLAEWFAALDGHVRPRVGDAPAGFYTGFARITGQACLLAEARGSLMPLVRHLRALEGWGTYRVVQTIGLAGNRIGRDQAAAFGMWIKAEAVLREAGLSDPAGGIGAIIRVAERIFPAGSTDAEVRKTSLKKAQTSKKTAS